MIIESTRNDAVKRARALANKKGRAEQGLHFIEGENLVREAVVSGAEFDSAFIEEGHDLMEAVLMGSGAQVYTVKRAVMEALTQTNTPQYVCATVKTPDTAVPEYYPEGLVVVLDNVQDPGNIGTIIRSADAMGCVGVLLGEGSADPFAPKPMRSAMGSTYHLPVWQGDVAKELTKLKSQGFITICGHLKGVSEMPPANSRCALVIGNESNGVSAEIASECYKYKIPMYGYAESLNASVAAGIMLFELARCMRSK